MRTITRLQPGEDWKLEIEFADGSIRWFDLKPLLSCEAFLALRDPAVFRSAQSHGYFIEWSNGADLSADTLYLDGAPTRDG